MTRRQLWGWEGKKVVFTNGVFDILHAGHVLLLERCKALGDVLIVGVNTDASARRTGGIREEMPDVEAHLDTPTPRYPKSLPVV